MQAIQMLDLYGQYLSMKTEIDQAIQEVIQSAQFVKGDKTKSLERSLSLWLDTNVITCGNGTDALQIAFMALGLQPGDEVITVPFTFVSTVEVLALLNLKPVFVDVNPDTFNIDPARIEKAITKKTKAILPIHLFGQCANMEEIMAIANKHDLFVVEDNCQALGADYYFSNGLTKKAGAIGHVGCTSFFPTKNLGAFGDGGAIFSNNKELAEKIRSIANHGMKEKYQYERIGLNSRLDNLQAAILEIKLKYFEEHTKRKQEIASFYDEKLSTIKGLATPSRSKYSTHTFHQYTIKAKDREQLKNSLRGKGIPSMVYYPKPLHLQEAYTFLGYKTGDFPASEMLAQQVLSLPIHSELKTEQMEYIADSILEHYN